MRLRKWRKWRVVVKPNFSGAILRTGEDDYPFSAAHAIDLQHIAAEHNRLCAEVAPMDVIYVADLHHDDFIKVGITERDCIERRAAELRRELAEPDLEIVSVQDIPRGRTAESWEGALVERLRRKRPQSLPHPRSSEVVQATPEEASTELGLMLREADDGYYPLWANRWDGS